MKKLLGNSIVFTISNVLLQAITFLLLPLYSNIISTSEYGICLLYTSGNNVGGFEKKE